MLEETLESPLDCKEIKIQLICHLSCEIFSAPLLYIAHCTATCTSAYNSIVSLNKFSSHCLLVFHSAFCFSRALLFILRGKGLICFHRCFCELSTEPAEILWGEEGRCWELCFPHLRVVMSTRLVADPTLGPIEVMPELPLVHVTRVEASTGFSTVGNCQHGLQSLWEPVPLGMSSLKSSSRGRVWGFGKAGWVHLCPELRTQVCLAEGPLWGLRASEMRAAP